MGIPNQRSHYPARSLTSNVATYILPFENAQSFTQPVGAMGVPFGLGGLDRLTKRTPGHMHCELTRADRFTVGLVFRRIVVDC